MSRFTDSGRGIASIVLTVVAAVLLALGTVAFYARTQVIDQRAFADRAADALADDDVRELVSREIVTGLIDNGTPDLVAARPLLETIVAAALQTEPFERLFRSAAVEANKTFFERDHESVALNLSDAVAGGPLRRALHLPAGGARSCRAASSRTCCGCSGASSRPARCRWPTRCACWGSCCRCWPCSASRSRSWRPPSAASACCAAASGSARRASCWRPRC